MKVLFFHGLESGPHGSKYRALKERFPGIVSPDFRGMREVGERIAHAIAETEGEEDLLIIGSSFGGLIAGLLAHRHPERVAGYILCAPALHWDDAAEITKTPDHAALIHGVGDEVVPVEASRVFARAHGHLLLEVEDGHRLAETRDLIVEVAARMAEAIEAT